MSFEQNFREEVRLIILKELAKQSNDTLTSSMLHRQLKEEFGVPKSREWVHEELRYLADLGAIILRDAGTVKIATLTVKGTRHLDREDAIEGVLRPSPPVA